MSGAEDVRVLAEVAATGDALSVRCLVANASPARVYLLCLSFAEGTPVAQLSYDRDGVAQLYSGGLGATPGRIPCYPSRNAGLPIESGAAAAVTFRFAHPVPEPDLALRPAASVPLEVSRIDVALQCSRGLGEPRPAPEGGFDVYPAPDFLARTSVRLPRPILVLRAAVEGPR